MNTKTIALLMALTMVIAATAVVAAVDGTDADDGSGTTSGAIDKGTVYIKSGESATVKFYVTEPDSTYYKNVVKWTAGENVVYNVTVTNGEEGENTASVSNSNVTFKSDGNGQYTATINSNIGNQTDYSIVYKVTTSYGSGDGTVDQSVSYILDIVVINNPLPSSLNMSLQFGKYTQSTNINEGNSETNDGFTFYAIGLPSGVQMTPDGDISGTPKDDEMNSEKSYDVTIVATHSASNQSYYKTYSMTVKAQDSKDFSYDVDGAKLVNTGEEGSYIILQGDSLTLTITGTTDTVMVYIVKKTNDVDEARDTLDPASTDPHKYNVPTDGSGEFSVVMVNENVYKSFTLKVVAISVDIETGIGFAPGYTISEDSTSSATE